MAQVIKIQFDADGLTVDRILPGIFLGPALSSDGQRVLIQSGISNVLNVTLESSLNYWSTEIQYKQIPVIDEEHVNIGQYFDESFEFVKSCVDKNESVYIHCHAGQSRSPTIVIFVVMRLLDVSLREAHNIVFERRDCISPNLGFFRHLVDAELRLRGQVSYPYDEYVVDKLVQFFGGSVSREMAEETYLSCSKNGAMTTHVLIGRIWGSGTK